MPRWNGGTKRAGRSYVQVTVHLPAELRDQLADEAKARRLPVSHTVADILDEYLNDEVTT